MPTRSAPPPEGDAPPPPDRRKRRRRPPRRDDIASPQSQAVYRRVLDTLTDGGVAFLVGGAYAFTRYTGIERSTKDFDVFVRRIEIARALDVLASGGFRTELTFPHWLGKAFDGDDFVDVIFGSGNGVAPVDDGWFDHAVRGTVLDRDVGLTPAEEMIWSKAFVMERERYDGADVAHLVRATWESLDWARLLDRFGTRWRVLLSHLLVFGFAYPDERHHVPAPLMQELLRRAASELDAPAGVGRVCRGTVVSRQQFLVDTGEWGYVDGRLADGTMTADEIAAWTRAIGTIK